MDTDYQKGSAWGDNADSGGATHRMDMSDMQDAGLDPLGESSADAVSAAQAGTDATVNQDSGGGDYASGIGEQSSQDEAQTDSGSGNSSTATDSGIGGTVGDASVGAISSTASRSRVPDYALEMVAAGLRQRGHNLNSADLDAALGEAGFTISPDPWHNYQPRPSLAEGAIQQQQAQAVGGFVNAAPASSIGSITLPAATESTSAPMGDALSQIQADEAQTVSPTGSAEEALPTYHPEPASGLEMQNSSPIGETDTAIGAATGMSDQAATELPSATAASAMADSATPVPPPTDTSLGFGAPAMSEDVPVQPSAFAAREPQPDASTTAEPSLSMGDNLPIADTSNSQPSAAMSGLDPQMSSATQSPASVGGTAPMQGDDATTNGASTVAMPPQPVANTVQVGGSAASQLAPYVALSNGVEFPLGDKSEILVGREDPVSDIFPDIDLTNFGGEDGGVSRRHARIIRDGDTYLLEDLNSTNYTKLNGVKLIPKIPQAMREGDHVSFGKVEATFHLYK